MVETAMQGRFERMTILVTGGTGSFGRTMVERLLARDCGEIRVLSRDECKQDQMRNEIADERVKFYIGDVRDRASVDGAMHGVHCVFHAAALKQVPSCEFFPIEAVRTNVLGSQNVVASAVMAGVRDCVCLSTDKAVYPINAMGMSKALMEKVVQTESRQLNGNSTVLSCVRYGNVMCSRGSIIPLFMRQIKERKPLTGTDPQMTRFMLSLAAAIALVEFPPSSALHGALFVLSVPACTIGELARVMWQVFDANREIRATGTRNCGQPHETLQTG